jgi:hypothetical protein
MGGAARWGFEQHEIRVRAVQEATRQPETENQRLLNEYLTKIKVQLTESKSIYNQLAEQYLELGWGILESYIIRARRDGSAKNALMLARMTDLVGRDSKIAELLEGYPQSSRLSLTNFWSMHGLTSCASGYCPK